MRYYEREHFDAYARIKDAGLDQWSDLHEHLLPDAIEIAQRQAAQPSSASR